MNGIDTICKNRTLIRCEPNCLHCILLLLLSRRGPVGGGLSTQLLECMMACLMKWTSGQGG